MMPPLQAKMWKVCTTEAIFGAQKGVVETGKWQVKSQPVHRLTFFIEFRRPFETPGGPGAFVGGAEMCILVV